MKNILKNMSFHSVIQAIKANINRFPLASLCIFIVTILWVYIIYFQDNSETINKIIITSILTFFVSLGISLYTESLKYTQNKNYIFQLWSLLFAWGFYFGLSQHLIDNIDFPLYLWLSIFWVMSFLYIAPEITSLCNKNTKNNTYFNYFYRINEIFFKSVVIGWVMTLLGFLGIFAIISLFDMSLYDGDIFAYWTVFSLSFTAPLFWLYQVPKSWDLKSKMTMNHFFEFIIKFIALPAGIFYFAILYVYSLKVLLSFWNWPKWEISWLVIGFSIFGYIVYIYSQVLESKYSIVQKIRTIFPYTIIPQIFMLFYAIWLRISQYDLTVNRYLIVAFGVWLLIVSCYFILSNKKYIWYIPTSLLIIIILISIGPWSVFHLPQDRQLDRLTSHLIEANILENDTITPLEKYEDIDEDLSHEIYEGIRYLCSFDACLSIRELFDDEMIDIQRKYKEESDNILQKNHNKTLNSWRIIDDITQYIKVRRKPYTTHNDYVYIHLNHTLKHDPIEISGYEYIYKVYHDSSYFPERNGIYINIKNEVFIHYENNIILDKISLLDIRNKLKKISSSPVLDKNKLVFDIEGQKYIYKLYIDNASLNNSKLNNIDGWVLAKQK